MSNFSAAEEIQKYKDLLDQGVITEEEFEQKKADLLNATPITTSSSASMSAHTTGIVAYLTWIGFLIAVLVGDREGAKFHINQALVINLFFFACAIPVLGWVWWIVMVVLWIMALVGACNDEQKPVPILGGIKILN
ncbi:Short C-terminal domain-containing protein [Pseudobutyrivibrio sp. JW11]|uniref:SHOCT domain-containing protein n=1 Tax=Pseudobutyrivibrio sp. JW11 TaxID=1855302 RepID=UPI0008E7DB0E|nr:SHOCT domain-containing protein [Pseudobutyrivibrio sp. JW11]SFN93883.1 Short C-terminal domain-containing protein [Pseudobutyrivibrio sp. JW11]